LSKNPFDMEVPTTAKSSTPFTPSSFPFIRTRTVIAGPEGSSRLRLPVFKKIGT